MLCSLKDIDGFKLNARDGEIGHVRDVYFDDERWVVRHLVVSTRGWLSGRKVLISPHSITGIDRDGKQLDVALTCKQIEGAPDIDTDKPVARQNETSYYDYYGYPYYWAGAGLWGAAAYPMLYPMAGAALAASPPTGAAREVDEIRAAEREAADSHLRSSDEVIGYAIEASDGRIGSIDDFLFDEQSWAIRYAVVDTGNWLPGRVVLISPDWIDTVSWSERQVHVGVSREAVKESPRYDRNAPGLTAEDEERLHRHYDATADAR